MYLAPKSKNHQGTEVLNCALGPALFHMCINNMDEVIEEMLRTFIENIKLDERARRWK